MFKFREYARLGAAIELSRLAKETKVILSAFPELRDKNRLAALLAKTGESPALAVPTKTVKPRRRRKLTEAEKRVISLRMKETWAARKRAS